MANGLSGLEKGLGRQHDARSREHSTHPIGPDVSVRLPKDEFRKKFVSEYPRLAFLLLEAMPFEIEAMGLSFKATRAIRFYVLDKQSPPPNLFRSFKEMDLHYGPIIDAWREKQKNTSREFGKME
jgi:hypothetical protein